MTGHLAADDGLFSRKGRDENPLRRVSGGKGSMFRAGKRLSKSVNPPVAGQQIGRYANIMKAKCRSKQRFVSGAKGGIYRPGQSSRTDYEDIFVPLPTT